MSNESKREKSGSHSPRQTSPQPVQGNATQPQQTAQPLVRTVGFNAPTGPATPLTSAPMNIPQRSGLSLQLANAAQGNPGLQAPSRLTTAPPSQPGAPMFDPYAHPTRQRLQGYFHMTDATNVPAIRREGLKPHESTNVKGIGPPKEGPGDYNPGGVYVVDDASLYKGDTRDSTIGVASATRPISDTNYPHSPGFTRHGAGYFPGNVPPLREAMTTDDRGTRQPYSFTLPMTPRTQAGAQRLIQATEGTQVSREDAAEHISGLMQRRYPMQFNAFDATTEFPATPPAPPNSPVGPMGLGLTSYTQFPARVSNNNASPSSFPEIQSPPRQAPAPLKPLSQTPALRVSSTAGNAVSPAQPSLPQPGASRTMTIANQSVQVFEDYRGKPK